MNSACQQVETLLEDFVTGQGDAKTRRLVQAHLDTCSACRARMREQTAIRHQLRLLAKRDATVKPPAHLWERAARTWDARDAQKRRVGKMRWALAGGCMLLFLLSAVWANLTVSHEFPVEAALRNFREVKTHLPIPMCATADADKAAHWLRDNLNAELPPINLSLSRGELLGADVIATPERPIGRLLYRTPQGIAAVYLAPNSGHFARTTQMPIGNQMFQVRNNVDVGMYGWEANTVGFGLLLDEPLSAGRTTATNAAQATAEKEQ